MAERIINQDSLPEVPESQIFLDECDVTRDIDDFLDSVFRYLTATDSIENEFAKRNARYEIRQLSTDTPGLESSMLSDDKIYLLIVRERVVASVILFRDGFNRTQAAYATYLNNEVPTEPSADV